MAFHNQIIIDREIDKTGWNGREGISMNKQISMFDFLSVQQSDHDRKWTESHPKMLINLLIRRSIKDQEKEGILCRDKKIKRTVQLNGIQADTNTIESACIFSIINFSNDQ